MKKKKTTLFIALGIGLFIFVLWLFLDAFRGPENKMLDYKFANRGARNPAADIVIVDIDEASIKHFGRWPWTRTVHAAFVDKVTAMGAKVIMFDSLFTEPENDRPLADNEFSKSIRRSGVVVLNSFFQGDEKSGNKWANPVMPIDKLAKYSDVGFANNPPDLDGILRRTRILVEVDSGIITSFGLAGLSVFLNQDPVTVYNERKVPGGEFLINYYGTNKVFPYISYMDVMLGNVPPEKFRDKIVLVGATAAALYDLKATPFSSSFPGVEVHATVMSNILQGNYLRPWPSEITGLLILSFALLAGLVLGRLSPLWGGVATFVIFFGYYFTTNMLFSAKNIYAEFLAPAASLALSYVGVLFFRFITEEKEKRYLKKTFSQYLSPAIMEKILSDPSYLVLGGQKQNLTVLFSDIRNFTTMTEEMKSEDLVAQLNEYLSEMVKVVFKHDGTLDKFIGDAVMAFWGAPIPQNDHHFRAVLCAAEMHEQLKKLNDKWAAEGKRRFDIGIGVNSGEMTVGNMGSKEKMEYTVIGDNVNIGARLESLNKEYGTTTIISDSTYQVVKDIVEVKPLGASIVKGKTKEVQVYAMLGKKNN